MKKYLCPKCNKEVEIKKDIYNKKDYFYCFNCKTTGETKFLKRRIKEMKTEKKTKMNNYQTKKEQARQKAIFWQLEISATQTPRRWGELWEEQIEFEKLAKRYGLIKEFKDNGII